MARTGRRTPRGPAARPPEPTPRAAAAAPRGGRPPTTRSDRLLRNTMVLIPSSPRVQDHHRRSATIPAAPTHPTFQGEVSILSGCRIHRLDVLIDRATAVVIVGLGAVAGVRPRITEIAMSQRHPSDVANEVGDAGSAD